MTVVCAFAHKNKVDSKSYLFLTRRQNTMNGNFFFFFTHSLKPQRYFVFNRRTVQSKIN